MGRRRPRREPPLGTVLVACAGRLGYQRLSREANLGAVVKLNGVPPEDLVVATEKRSSFRGLLLQEIHEASPHKTHAEGREEQIRDFRGDLGTRRAEHPTHLVRMEQDKEGEHHVRAQSEKRDRVAVIVYQECEGRERGGPDDEGRPKWDGPDRPGGGRRLLA
jgi:hypothetical protein